MPPTLVFRHDVLVRLLDTLIVVGAFSVARPTQLIQQDVDRRRHLQNSDRAADQTLF